VSALAVLNTVLQVITLLLMLSKMFAPKQPEQAYEKVKDDDKGKKEGEKGESASEKLDLEQVLEAAKQGQVVYSSITKLE
jgi:sortase (surface protein transpeptidase)